MVGSSLQEIINKSGLSPEDFAEEINYGKSSIYKVLRGDTKKISPKLATKISKKFPEYSREYLLSLNEKDKLGHLSGKIKNAVVLNEGLIKRQDELHSLAFFLNNNYEELVNDPVFKMFIDRVKAEARTELRHELSKELNQKAEKDKKEIRDKLTDANKVKE